MTKMYYNLKKAMIIINSSLIVCFALSMIFPFVVSGFGFDDCTGSFILTYVPVLLGGLTTLLYPVISPQFLGFLFWVLVTLGYLSPLIGVFLARKHRWWIILPSVFLITDLVFCVRGNSLLEIVFDCIVLALTALHLWISLKIGNSQKA